jgi:pyrimidine deaminase RibD-like protein
MRDLPKVLADMDNTSEYYAPRPPPGQRIVLYHDLVRQVGKQHGKAASAWAVHCLIEQGKLTARYGSSDTPSVLSKDGIWHGGHRYEVRELTYALIQSTPPLWEWWTDVSKKSTRPAISENDSEREFMELAIQEARKSVSEDDRAHPKVGAVIVKEGTILATCHRGELGNGEHAEYTALEKKLADHVLAGATVYTTLEPCTTRNHPKIPCAKRLIERKVKRVVIGMLDPNEEICGRGERILREHGIVVDRFPHTLIVELEELNREFTRSHPGMDRGIRDQ